MHWLALLWQDGNSERWHSAARMQADATHGPACSTLQSDLKTRAAVDSWLVEQSVCLAEVPAAGEWTVRTPESVRRAVQGSRRMQEGKSARVELRKVPPDFGLSKRQAAEEQTNY